ncbi:single-stranded DNA-binding protein [Kocuria rhizophila]|nr:single-stranded DNA-binding protein [Kocuria rhizophila]
MVARFRLATTTRRFDATNSWHNTSTNWYAVRCSVPWPCTSWRAPLRAPRGGRGQAGHQRVAVGDRAAHRGPGGRRGRGPRPQLRHRELLRSGRQGPRADFGTGQSPGGCREAEEGRAACVRGEAQPGRDARYRDAQSLGLGEDRFVDLAYGCADRVDKDDHTFDGLGQQDDHDAAANGCRRFRRGFRAGDLEERGGASAAAAS